MTDEKSNEKSIEWATAVLVEQVVDVWSEKAIAQISTALLSDALKRLERANVIAVLARETRAAQKAYFRSRSKEDLIRSKELEGKLDKALAG